MSHFGLNYNDPRTNKQVTKYGYYSPSQSKVCSNVFIYLNEKGEQMVCTEIDSTPPHEKNVSVDGSERFTDYKYLV
jgi:hypothetical protein